ncbi:MAG: hypothetical protein NVS2B11_07050 [Acetobacteraceae bacterium]
MTADVISFGPRRPVPETPAAALPSFIVCNCQRDDEVSAGFAILAVHDSGGALVSGLVCLACGLKIWIDGGWLPLAGR